MEALGVKKKKRIKIIFVADQRNRFVPKVVQAQMVQESLMLDAR